MLFGRTVLSTSLLVAILRIFCETNRVNCDCGIELLDHLQSSVPLL